MRRSLFVGAVWLLVTAVSILVAYAAVGEVRNRVVEQPRLIPVAATTVAPTPVTDATTTTTIAPLASTSTTLDVTTSTDPVVQTTVTSGAATTSPPTTTATTSAQGRIETYSTPGGSVSIEVFSDRLRLLGAVPAAGYSVAEQEIAPMRIEIEFTSSSQEVKFHAELHSDGEVETQVEVENE